MSRPSELIIGGESIPPGTRKTVDVSLPLLYTHSPVVLSVNVIRGKQDGPRLFVSAAIHGDEINGIEIIRRLVRSPSISKLKGTLITVPVVNVYGFVRQSRYLPDRRDLNRTFPGSVQGSLAARLAYSFMSEIVDNSTHGIDLHTGAVHRENLPQIRGSFEKGDAVDRMAGAFGAPVILNSDLRDGSLREAARDRGIPVIIYEGGEALRFDEVAIRAGVNGIIGVMRDLDMLRRSRRSASSRKPKPVVASSSTWVRAPQSGVLRAVQPMGARVKKNDLLGFIADPYGENEEPVLANAAGVIIGKVNFPLVNEGEALYHIARFGEPLTAADTVEQFQSELSPETDELPPSEHPIN